MVRRRSLIATGLGLGAALAPPWLRAATPDDAFDGDPFRSFQWAELKKEFLGPRARTVFDARVKVQGPAFAEDPMNVPITVATDLPGVQRILVLVDRNPIRKVLELQPMAAQPAVSFRFKLEQASPVRAAVQTADGLWHVGGTLVDSAGGGCTVAGVTPGRRQLDADAGPGQRPGVRRRRQQPGGVTPLPGCGCASCTPWTPAWPMAFRRSTSAA